MDDYVSDEERREAVDSACEAVEDAVEAVSRAMEAVEGSRKSPPSGGEVAVRIAHEAVTSALVDLHDALIALETI